MTTGNERCGKMVDKRESKKRKMEGICEMKGRQRMAEKRIPTRKAESRVRSELRSTIQIYRFSKEIARSTRQCI